MANLILLRHGSTKLNKTAANSVERIRGHQDIPLDDKGKREAVALGAQFGSMGIQKVYTTDLKRGTEVAMNIARVAKVPLIKTFDLRPWNLGVLTNKEVDKVLPVMNKLVERSDVPIPNGESFDTFRMRYLPVLKGLLDEAARSPKPIVAVTHSRNIQLARAWDKAGRPDDYSFDLGRMMDYKDEVPPGHALELEPQGNIEKMDKPVNKAADEADKG